MKLVGKSLFSSDIELSNKVLSYCMIQLLFLVCMMAIPSIAYHDSRCNSPYVQICVDSDLDQNGKLNLLCVDSRREMHLTSEVQWLNDGALHNMDSTGRIHKQDARLIFESILISDEGNWTCSNGSLSPPFKLYAGKVNYSTELATLNGTIEKNSFSIPCNIELGVNTAQANYRVTVTRRIFYSDGSSQVSLIMNYQNNMDPKILSVNSTATDPTSYRFYSSNLTLYVENFSVPSPQNVHGVNFTCDFYVAIRGTVTTAVTTTAVIFGFHPPEIERSLENVTVIHKGSSYSFTVEVYSHPSPSRHWWQLNDDEITIANSSHFVIEPPLISGNTSTFILILINASEKHNGMLQFTAQLANSTASTQTILMIPRESAVMATLSTNDIIGIVAGVVILILLVLLTTGIVLIIIRHGKKVKTSNLCRNEPIGIPNRLTLTKFTVQSSFKLNLPPHLIITASSVKLNEIIGQGEFGIVYKADTVKNKDGQIIMETMAVKTLKGFHDKRTVKELLKECSKMYTLDHPNVLTLTGVCLDGGTAPYIIMPFMANGSLLAYLKNNRRTLVVSQEAEIDDEEIDTLRKRLMDMCFQIAKGMEYLAAMKVVHRDLAARNCMIDINFVIKVADFGLSESTEMKEYFRQDKDVAVKLPLKWLAPECLDDYIFSEKSDVWAYGVTCWEIFSGGKAPYPGVVPTNLPRMLLEGHRLEKPVTAACNNEMYAFMLQCWKLKPEKRPSFSNLVNTLSQSIEAMAGYMDVFAFSGRDSDSEPVATDRLETQ